MSRFFPIYGGHKAPAKRGVENCQARHSKEASAASDLFGWHSPSPPLYRRPLGVAGHKPSAPAPGEPLQSPIQPDRSAIGQLSGRDDIVPLENAYDRDRGDARHQMLGRHPISRPIPLPPPGQPCGLRSRGWPLRGAGLCHAEAAPAARGGPPQFHACPPYDFGRRASGSCTRSCAH